MHLEKIVLKTENRQTIRQTANPLIVQLITFFPMVTSLVDEIRLDSLKLLTERLFGQTE